MGLNDLFDAIEKARQAASWRSAFGDPREIDGRTVIPVSRAGYGFGLGFVQGHGPVNAQGEPEGSGEGRGTGGKAWSYPLGVIVITEQGVSFQKTVDATRITVAALLVGAWTIWQIARTIRALGRRAS